MDALECKSASRCAVCPNFANGRCALEAELDLFFERAPVRSRHGLPVTLAWHDTRSGLAEA